MSTIIDRGNVSPAPPRADASTRKLWTGHAPTIGAPATTLRGLVPSDADSLFSLLTTEPVGQFILPPPHSTEHFIRFIDWTHRQEDAGRHICFGVVPPDRDVAVGLIQVRREASDCPTAEWGFVLSERYWGTGLFMASAHLVLDFLFGNAGIHRLEARTIIENGRASGALTKLGATREGVLRRGFYRNGEYHDQVMWSILAGDCGRSTTLH